MEVRVEIPEGYWLEGLAQVRPELTWRAYLRTQVKPRSGQIGTFLGAVGRTPQEAINKAQEAIEESRAKFVVARPERDYLSVDDLDL